MALFGKKKGVQENLLGKKTPDYKKQQQNQGRKPSAKNKIIALVVIVIVVIALYAYFVLQVNQTVINGTEVVNITSTGALYNINSKQYYISLAHVSLSGAKADIHISELPIFINPLLNVTLTLNNITKLNVGTNYSNIGMQLQSIGPSSVTVQISPIETSLDIAPDSNKISAVWTMLSNSTSGTGVHSSTTVGTTTTIASGGTTSATTTQSTTTVQATNQTAASLASTLKHYNLYGLMLNFSFLYDNTSNCNHVLYNNAYFRYYSTMPSPGQQTDYVNVSQFVPYNLSSTTTNLGGGNFELVYRTKTLNETFNNQIALEINVSTSSSSITGTSFLEAFQGLNYTVLRSNYQRAQSIGGACGIMVP